jgi:hypothetical protein
VIRKFAALLLVLAVMVGNTGAVLAADRAEPGTEKAQTSPEAVSESERSAEAEGRKIAEANGDDKKADKGSGGGFFGRAVAFTTAWVIGTPIAMCRASVSETVKGTNEWTGESDNPLLWVPLGLFCLPWGVLDGVAQGPIISGMNAWKYSDDSPFSKESFSLGDDLD